ncbi:peroxisomal NADH pyrophosphatase NUDT12 [Brachionus plicatilis]|uniref:NAD(+) diphosphatase n=1 Tax=Brachionus plicatilis TaxID=10195 RepID=A0A3M7R7W5_BRAPC|nr:peroxisomal NADH pyrophosphatase NUDT12 [Brachionus plicatilis]
MSNPTVNYFAHSFIDRCAEKRKDSNWISQKLKEDSTIFVLFHIDKPFVYVNDSEKMFSLCKFNYSQIKPFLEAKCNYVFLGLEYMKNSGQFQKFSPYSCAESYDRNNSKAWFVIETSGFDADIEKVSSLFPEQGKFFEGNFLRLMAIQDLHESSIIAQARSILCWIDRNKFCASCGTKSQLDDAGSKLTCTNPECKSNNKALNKHVPSNIHYPRVDPVAIMLIINKEQTHVLLGRKRQFPKNMFSCLAGYIEAGKKGATKIFVQFVFEIHNTEFKNKKQKQNIKNIYCRVLQNQYIGECRERESIEEAVRRESFEESGVYTDRVVYHSSQPWPFPSTLMIGCFAYATSEKLNIDQDEIQEARWFSLDELDLILENKHPDKITIPTERTIAHQLIKHFSMHRPKL